MYDLIVIGFGPGGYEATLLALRKKLKVAIVEKDKLGGLCLNRACIPTKYFWNGAKQIEKLKKLNNYGINIYDYSISWTDAFEKKNEAIKGIRKGLRQLLKTKKVPIYKGIGKIIDKNKVLVKKSDGTEKIVEGKNILISTGSIPSSIGGIEIDEDKIISTDYLLGKMDKLPKSILIVGGGVAGCELGYILSVYGCKVYIVELMDRLLPSKTVAKDISRYLLRKFKKLGITTYLNTTVKDYEKTENSVIVNLSNGERLEVEKVMLSVGRKPNTENLDSIGIEKDKRGFIKVNEYMQTNIDNIYACGDVVFSPMLAYVSSLEGKTAVKNILGEKTEIDYSNIPYAMFTAYEIGTVGLNEEEAKEKGINTVSGIYTYSYNEKAVDELETDGFIKLVFEKETKRLIGSYIVGSSASELIHTLEMAIKNNYTAEDLHRFVYFHPSLSELIPFASFDIAEGKLF